MLPKEVSVSNASDAPIFSVCSLVTDLTQYQLAVKSFERFGFHAGIAEFLYIDNTRGNRFDAFRGLNLLIYKATAKYIILCHQDIELIDDGVQELQQRLGELDQLDPNWAVAGNVGGVTLGVRAIRISDPFGADQRIGNLPARVDSLDENWMVLRRDALLGFSLDIGGFHLYGTDICQQARLRGCSTWVIDFHLKHHSPGNQGAEFFKCRELFEQKYARIAQSRYVQTSCDQLVISASGFRRFIWNARRTWSGSIRPMIRFRSLLRKTSAAAI
jgi:hypothetical protein